MRIVTIALAAMLAASGMAAAKVSPLGLALAMRACQQIEDDTMRLECFDAILGDTTAKQPEERPTSAWQTEEHIDPIDDTKTGFAGVFDNTKDMDDNVLLVRCRMGEFNVLLTFDGEYFTDDIRSVVFRVDQDVPDEIAMSLAINKETYGLWNHKQASTFVDRLSGKSQLAVRLKESSGETHSAVFDLTGMDAALDEVAGDCRK